MTWFVGAEKTWTLDARAIGPNGNIGQRPIPLEPLSIVMNLGMADNFAPQNASIHQYMPAFLRIDYIRIYQDPDDESVTCDPPGYETTEYIKKHRKAYDNANYTLWYVVVSSGLDLVCTWLITLGLGTMLVMNGPKTPICMTAPLYRLHFPLFYPSLSVVLAALCFGVGVLDIASYLFSSSIIEPIEPFSDYFIWLLGFS